MKTLIVAFALFAATSAEAASYYVSSHYGSDGYSCYMASWGVKWFAKRTVNAAKACGGNIIVLD